MMMPNSRSCHCTCCGEGLISVKFWASRLGMKNMSVLKAMEKQTRETLQKRQTCDLRIERRVFMPCPTVVEIPSPRKGATSFGKVRMTVSQPAAESAQLRLEKDQQPPSPAST